MKTADTLFINGQILTQDENRSKASQLALSAGRILAVGDDLSTFQGQTTEIIDLQGSVITPGFIDAHLHFLWGGSSRLAVPIHEARSKQDFIRIVSEYAKTTKAGSWITGAGWNEHKYSDATYPQKEWLDEAAPGHPSILIRHDGHSAIASSKALALAGINHDTPDPIGGIVDKDEQGQPTGILREAAIGLVDSLVPEESDNDLEKNFEAAQEYLLDHGVTAIGDMIFDLKHFHFLQKMALQKKLKIRVTVYLPILKWTEIKSMIDEGTPLLPTSSRRSMTNGKSLILEAWDERIYSHTLFDQISPSPTFTRWLVAGPTHGLDCLNWSGKPTSSW